ncbi:Dienelactone hydrolase [Trema orientale]|uniref:Dienelactone hydrolase n=1 Tax=Trema orientale TaxID=63057 RepID=A0A2P5FWZ6_TREOI|nr:Dienelactone hydrolase [Trema orientale]
MAGPQCCSNPPTLDPNSGDGHVEKVGGLSAYVTGSSKTKLAIVLISDIYGYEAPKLRKLADKIAAAGFFVAVPDFFHGDPFIIEESATRPIPVWLKDHGTDKGLEEAKQVILDIKSQGFTAVGAAGFCWGGKVVADLAKTDFIHAGVLLHPAFVTVDDCKEFKKPLAILAAEVDQWAPPELIHQYENALSERTDKIDYFVKLFPGVAHGWTVRYADNEEAIRRANESHEDLLNWVTKYVK